VSTPGNALGAARQDGWIPCAALLVLFWGVWGASSGLPTSRCGYPDAVVYVIWAFTMLIPASFALRGRRFDRRPIAGGCGLVVAPVTNALGSSATVRSTEEQGEDATVDLADGAATPSAAQRVRADGESTPTG